MSRLSLLLALVPVALISIGGCSSDTGSPVSSAAIFCPVTPTTLESTLAGPGSGLLTSGNTTLEIPPGALAPGTVVSLSSSVVDGRSVSEVSVRGGRFLLPVVLTMRKPDPAGLGSYAIYRWDGAAWINVGGTDQGGTVGKSITVSGRYETDENI
jgi:hypothetical protein